MPRRRSALLLLPSVTALAACLSAPPGERAPLDGTPAAALDAAVADAPDAQRPPPPCTSGECVQLLAIGLYQHEPDTTSSIVLLRRDAAAGPWERMDDIAGSPDYNAFDLDWGDCCGPTGVADDLPDLLAVHWNVIQYSQLRYVNRTLSTTGFVAPPQDGIPNGEGRWFDVDDDEDLDILTGMPTTRWYRKTSTGYSSEILLDEAKAWLQVGNWDDDADPEILVVDSREIGPDLPGRGTRVLDRTAGGWDTFLPALPDNREKTLLCDVVGTHHLDVVVAQFHQDTIIYPNRGSALDGNWLDLDDRRRFAPAAQNYPPMACGDLDGDGDDDLLMSSGNGLVAVFHDGAEVVSVWTPVSIGAETAISDLILADVDHDGLPEILVTLGDAADGAEPTADEVAFLLPNRTQPDGELTLGAPELLLSSRQDALSLAYVEFPLPR